MRKIRDVLRLECGLGRSNREIGAMLRISHSTVGSYVRRAREAGFSKPLPDDLDDGRLEAMLYPPTPPSRVRRPEPAWAQVHRPRAGHRRDQLQVRQHHPVRRRLKGLAKLHLDALALARANGSYPKLVQRLARTWLLVLDDWGLASLSGQGRYDLLEVLDDRYARGGTILASQLPVEHWHDIRRRHRDVDASALREPAALLHDSDLVGSAVRQALWTRLQFLDLFGQ